MSGAVDIGGDYFLRARRSRPRTEDANRLGRARADVSGSLAAPERRPRRAAARTSTEYATSFPWRVERVERTMSHQTARRLQPKRDRFPLCRAMKTSLVVRVATALPAALLLSVAVACGSDVQDVLAPGGGDAGVGAPCSTGAECASGACVSGACQAAPQFGDACSADGAACTGPEKCCSNRCESGACAAAVGCTGNAGACTSGADCCSNRCEGGKCVAASCQAKDGACCGDADCCTSACVDGKCAGAAGATCLFPDQPCDSHESCCSGRCEPVTGQAGVTKCTDACRANGQACTRAQDCCSLGCFGGVCAAQLCKLQSESCGSAAECCSGICTGGTCQIDEVNSTCRPTGETCNSGPQRGCCLATEENELCDKDKEILGDPPRCTLPPSVCRGDGASCANDSQCCSRRCDESGTCVASCIPDGQACGAKCSGTCSTAACDDCCGGFCNNGTCSSTPAGGDAGSGGKPTGSPCTVGGECRSQLCLAGFCETPAKVN